MAGMGRRWRQRLRKRCAWGAVAIGCSVAAPHAWAGEAQPIEFHVASGQLDKTLLQIAKLGHLVLSFDAALTRGLLAHSVDGTMTAKEALARALTGTQLELVEVTGGTLTLRRSEATAEPSSASPPTHVLPKIDVLASADDDAAEHGFVVEGNVVLDGFECDRS